MLCSNQLYDRDRNLNFYTYVDWFKTIYGYAGNQLYKLNCDKLFKLNSVIIIII